MPYTRQEILDKVWDWFLVQGNPPGVRRREDGTYTCCYRTPEGYRCAVGLLIPDDVYSSDMDGGGYSVPDIDRLLEVFEPLQQLFNMDDAQFLGDLQDAHDSATTTGTSLVPAPLEEFQTAFEAGLRSLAGTYGLQAPA